jgi:hypothetical protein
MPALSAAIRGLPAGQRQAIELKLKEMSFCSGTAGLCC